jgi:hypothetical protein
VKLAGGGRLLLQSDKPLYQPSQIMHLRVMALRDQGGVPLSKGQVHFEVHDPRQNLILSTQRRVSDHGIFAVDLPLADELVLGSYTGGSREQLRLALCDPARPAGQKGGGQPDLQAGVVFAAQLDATAVDGAGHREPARLKAPLSKLPVRVDFIAEAGWLIPEFQNRIWGIATYPDGTPATGIEMELLFETDLTAADAEPPRRRTDAMGVATFLVKPSANAAGSRGETRRCSPSQRAMNVQVNDRSGLVAIQERCMDIAQKGGLLLRTDRAIYPQGMPLELSVERFQRRPHEVLFHLRSLTSAKPLLLPLRLKARLPGRVLVPPPTLRETHYPEHLITGLPVEVTVLPQP